MVRKSIKGGIKRGIKKADKQKILLYATILAVVALAVLSIYTWLQSTYFGENYKKALESENPADICATPAGYTDESWRAHMSHHPDQYKKCLEEPE